LSRAHSHILSAQLLAIWRTAGVRFQVGASTGGALEPQLEPWVGGWTSSSSDSNDRSKVRAGFCRPCRDLSYFRLVPRLTSWATSCRCSAASHLQHTVAAVERVIRARERLRVRQSSGAVCGCQ